MLSLAETEEVLRDAKSGLQDAIIRDIGKFTVALLAVFESQGGFRLELAGTGTLVAVGDSHYILTARHVWEKVLKSARAIGITLKEHVHQEFLLDTRSILIFGPDAPEVFAEWGPDLVFLRVPPGRVGAINAYQTFYNLTRPRQTEPGAELETWVLMGTPAVLGSFKERHADLQICGFFVWGNTPRQTRGEFDYLDIGVDVSLPGMPEGFGGVSGGGLWHVLIRRSESSVGIDWCNSLEGVAFYQSDVANGRRTIRCHGDRSIRTAMPSSSK